jgi:ABC-type glycerol-3-phosphate transport system substrate-binding protein
VAWWLRATFSALLLLMCVAWAEEPVQTVPLRLGVTDCYADRLPFDTFKQLNPEVALELARWPRNPWDSYREKPLPRTHNALPQVIEVIAGPYAEDIVQLADRGLITPLDDKLAAWGVSKDDFLPGALDAVTYRGKVWAIPHHAVAHALRYNRALFEENNLTPAFGSWQEMLEALATIQTSDGTPAIPFSAPFGAYRTAAYMANACGAPMLNLADLALLDSPKLTTALELVQSYQQRGTLRARPDNWPLRREAHIAAGLDHVDSLYPSATYGVMPVPTRLLPGDEAATPRTSGILRAFAVRRHSPDAAPALDAFFEWILSGEADLIAFENSNVRVPEKEWVLDLVHVPLRKSILDGIDFEYAARKYPAYANLVTLIKSARFADHPPALERAVTDLLVQHMELRLGRDPVEAILSDLKQQAYDLIATTPVESLVYREY